MIGVEEPGIRQMGGEDKSYAWVGFSFQSILFFLFFFNYLFVSGN